MTDPIHLTLDELQAKITALVIGSPGMGGGHDFIEFGRTFYPSLDEDTKTNARTLILEYLENGLPSSSPPNVPRERFKAITQHKIARMCADIGLHEAIPTVERLLVETRDRTAGDFIRVYQAVVKLEIRRMIPYLIEDASPLLHHAHAEPSWSRERLTTLFNAWHAARAVVDLDPQSIEPFLDRYLELVREPHDCYPMEIVVRYYRATSHGWHHALAKRLNSLPDQAGLFMYLLVQGWHAQHLAADDTRQVFGHFNTAVQHLITQRLVEGLHGELSKRHRPMFSIRLCGVLRVEAAVAPLIAVAESFPLTDTRLEDILVALGRLGHRDALPTLQRYAKDFTIEWDYRTPASGPPTSTNPVYRSWHYAGTAVRALAHIAPEYGLHEIARLLDSASDKAVFQRLFEVERCFAEITKISGNEAVDRIKHVLGAGQSGRLQRLQTLMSSDDKRHDGETPEQRRRRLPTVTRVIGI